MKAAWATLPIVAPTVRCLSTPGSSATASGPAANVVTAQNAVLQFPGFLHDYAQLNPVPGCDVLSGTRAPA